MPKRFSWWILTHPWRTLSIRRQGYIVVAIPILCLLGSLGTFSWLRYSIDTAQAWVDHTDRTLAESNQILNAVLNAETGARGYTLTHQAEFLAPYRSAEASLGRRLARLQQLVADNPRQTQRVQQIKQLAQARLTALSQLVQRVDQSPAEPLQRKQLLPFLLAGKREMDRLRASLTEFNQEETRLLKARRQQLNAQRSVNEIALWTAAGLSLLGSIFALSLFSQLERNLRDRELRLRESKTLIEAIVSNVVDGVVILDRQGRIESLNPSTMDMFGYTLPEAVGQAVSLLLQAPRSFDTADPSEGKGLEDWDSVLQTLPRRWTGTGVRSGGGLFPVEVSISQIPFDHRQIVIIRDVTERQEAAAQLQARADDLARTNAALAATNTALAARNLELDQFTYVASHDLKAPLRAIASLSEWIEEDLADHIPAESQPLFALLRRRIHRMETLINGLVDYARIGRSDPLVTKAGVEVVDVQQLLDEILEILELPKTFTLAVLSPMPIFPTRRLPLRQVLASLIDNAHKHHPRSTGKITLSVLDRGSVYEFAVQDDGDGIAPQYHAKIFTLFQTLQPRDVREDIGVGLAIAKKILETEGGKIWVESQEGKGATFYFTWPKSIAPSG